MTGPTERRRRPFAQVDVFSQEPYLGNPVAVVLDGRDLTDASMQRFAAWTNLSETTFVLPPSSRDADYGLRIFTPAGELPFAGHPTLGSAHAWLEAGGVPRSADVVVQECPAGLITLRRSGGSLAFRAPERVRTGPLDAELVERIARGLGIDRRRVVGHQWVDNGPGWAAVQLASAEEVLALEPDDRHLADLMVGVIGAYPDDAPLRYEVRVFAAPGGIREDPVTGSFNAGVAQWLIGAGAAPSAYRAGQGARVGRQGVVSVESAGDDVWVEGASVTCIRGEVEL
jgi:PhzF family phenazine biosynthesis protein